MLHLRLATDPSKIYKNTLILIQWYFLTCRMPFLKLSQHVLANVKQVSGDIIVHPEASWTSLIWALYQVGNAKDY